MGIIIAIAVFMSLFVGCATEPSDEVIAYLETADSFLARGEASISGYSIEIERMNQALIDQSLDWGEYNVQSIYKRSGIEKELRTLFLDWVLLQHPLGALEFHSAVQKLLQEQWWATTTETNFGLWPLTEGPGDRQRRVNAARYDLGMLTSAGIQSRRDAVADERRSID